MNKQTNNNDQFIEVEGTVQAMHPNMKYIVEIDYNELKHEVLCYVSGKMKKYFIEIKKGDRVKVKISLYDIDNGIITRRLTERVRFNPNTSN
jgi:translation initiation factor IF-1